MRFPRWIQEWFEDDLRAIATIAVSWVLSGIAIGFMIGRFG